MFKTKQVYEKYGISGLIMPYLWLVIYIYFHFVLIGLWFVDPGFTNYITLIIHVVLTVNAIAFAHPVLLWSAEKQDDTFVANFFSAIIRKMSDSPIELITEITEPLTNDEYETKTKVIKCIYYLFYTLLSIFIGYIVFMIVALITLITYLVERK